MRENLELHTGPDCVEQCGGRVLLHGRGAIKAKGVQTGCSRDWIAVKFKRTDQFVHRLERGQVICFTERLGSHETCRDSRVVVAGGSIVQENGGQQGAWGGETSGSLDEVFGPPGHLEAFESSEHFSGVILIFSRLQTVGSSRFDRGGVCGMPVDFTEAALARAGWRDALSLPAMIRKW